MEKIDNIVTYKYVNFKNEIFYILSLTKITNIDFVSRVKIWCTWALVISFF
jgi:hypothetical protein